MMEAARTSETLVNFYQTTRYYNPEDSNLHYVICVESYFTANGDKEHTKFWGWLLHLFEMGEEESR
jgi:hypothetical protein